MRTGAKETFVFEFISDFGKSHSCHLRVRLKTPILHIPLSFLCMKLMRSHSQSFGLFSGISNTTDSLCSDSPCNHSMRYNFTLFQFYKVYILILMYRILNQTCNCILNLGNIK